MRALAFGILEPDGERHRLALVHHSRCPACRAYVASLRGLAAALPPGLLAWRTAAAILASSSDTGAHAARGLAGTFSRSATGRRARGRRCVGGSRRVRSGRRGLAARGGIVRREARGRLRAGARRRRRLRGSRRPAHALQQSETCACAASSPAADAASIAPANAEYRLGDLGRRRRQGARRRRCCDSHVCAGAGHAAGEPRREFGPEQALASATAPGGTRVQRRGPVRCAPGVGPAVAGARQRGRRLGRR